MILVLLLALAGSGLALDNGLARTPPMGFNSWERFLCETDCITYPDTCISENLYRRQADLLVELGYKDLGYVYVNIDDCWMEMQRDNLTDRLVADKKRFPNGIKALADYVHQKGLKLGIYTDIGTKTCGGYPGTQDHYDIDAQTLAEWEIDMLKVDGCYANASDFAVEYPALGRSLNNTGRPILYSCSWPAYQDDKDKDYVAIAEHCNIWRNWDDIEDSWASITSIAKYFGDRGDAMVPTAGPGNYHDPDMLVIGNYGLSCPEAQVQMSIWAILAAPLLISADLQQVPPCHEAVLKNKDLIAANQDPLGMMGERVYKLKNVEVWRRYISPLSQNGNNPSALVALVNWNTMGSHHAILLDMDLLELKNPAGYMVKDVYNCSADYDADCWKEYTGKKIYQVPPSSTITLVFKVKDPVPPSTE